MFFSHVARALILTRAGDANVHVSAEARAPDGSALSVGHDVHVGFVQHVSD